MTNPPARVGDAVDRRFPRSVYGLGTEPDPRFTLANERTFLAWIRTALALLASGVALDAVGIPLHPGLRLAASYLLLVCGTGLPWMAWLHWTAAERAMRRGQPLPSAAAALPLGLGVLVVALTVIGATVLG